MSRDNVIVDFEKEAKRRARKQAFQNKVSKGWEWYKENQAALTTAAATVVAVGGLGLKVVSKATSVHNARAEERHRRLEIYDRQTGTYRKLKRELTKSEYLEFDKRRSHGERTATILEDMKVLKK